MTPSAGWVEELNVTHKPYLPGGCGVQLLGEYTFKDRGNYGMVNSHRSGEVDGEQREYVMHGAK